MVSALRNLYELKPTSPYKQMKHGPMSLQDWQYARANREDNLAHFSHRLERQQ